MKRKDSLPRMLNDQQLYVLLKKGHPSSLEHIHLRYKRLLFWLGKQMLDDDFVVETLVQDTFLKLWLHRDSIETPNHIPGFLRLVLKRDCITYFTAPKTQFTRFMDSFERFGNDQDYFAGYNPLLDEEHLLSQESDQKDFDEVKKVLSVLDPKRKHLIELCLDYGFQYKPIAEAMGSSVTGISNEVSRAIDDLRKILNRSYSEKPREKASDHKEQRDIPSHQQLEIMKRRIEQKLSFTVIARELKLSEKQVHREFLHAYECLQKENTCLKSF
ncbi:MULTISPECIES: RNA polymerase sigma factor [Chryseobacterium]|uniref:RNA polymerase sigma factor (Sigma-70 family) n=1 Tax=Chryseobacterium camelliae TaxID=1265445 RepID=A0ABU0TEE0_9FLAO|nr:MULTISPECIES: sigma-70 family RNA polymerase sigma factor [Chryseobacterium]MDT3406847.1 RNA polymerase sigma factor (sigma-70 family) [Pseudacidovorax intermedius]MDQ1095357.1 RNA polymerase sigma factor (sigma-70 family) [Chryseobacterium camelliae]MDQ1099295.1 RNA polymerase sigma factor (sigma-70 family) [Chryseobacterium sp. SORGH_AS_1048]MDR6086644.1 RNA polymerase sigma factor (sigma-70 family) [Chryseobacterium sp. SORGH_AS_0909]MDR6131016.1 RNA polymerase sigma factor (sigma-70 fam